MVRVKMCLVCRGMKQKCTPVDRTWIEGGKQEKCARCIRYGHECGPPEYPAQRPRRISEGSHAQPINFVVQSAIEGPIVAAPNSTPAMDIVATKLQRRKQLTQLDMQVEATKKLCLDVQILIENQRQDEPLYSDTVRLKNTTVQDLLLALGPAEAMADDMKASGEIEAAESAYIRVLDAYRVLDVNTWHKVKSLLLKMSEMFSKVGEHLRAENLIWDALVTRDFPLVAQHSDLELLKTIAKSLPQTSNELSATIQPSDRGIEGGVPAHLSCPLPPLQRMMQSTYASTVMGCPFAKGEYSDMNATLDIPVLGGIEAILEVLRVLPPAYLDTRDHLGQSPLFMAASLQMESLGRAIIKRATEIPGMPLERLIDARDRSGQTILGAAIFNHCSMSFVRILIAKGAAVDPKPLSRIPMTPLQAAVCRGSFEMVELLLNCEAKVDRVYNGNKTPLNLAIESGFDAIANLLRAASGGTVGIDDGVPWEPP